MGGRLCQGKDALDRLKRRLHISGPLWPPPRPWEFIHMPPPRGKYMFCHVNAGSG